MLQALDMLFLLHLLTLMQMKSVKCGFRLPLHQFACRAAPGTKRCVLLSLRACPCLDFMLKVQLCLNVALGTDAKKNTCHQT